MKKICMILVLSAMLIGSVFAYTEGKTVRDVGVPYHVSHIEFWNGGTKIASMDDATVEILVQTNESFLTLTKNNNPIQFYIYKVTCKGKTVKIIDSEALAILYTE